MRYAVRRESGWWVPWAEAALACYGAGGFVAVALVGEWAALPFQAMFAVGFGWLAWEDLGRRIEPAPVLRAPQAVPAPVFQEAEAEAVA